LLRAIEERQPIWPVEPLLRGGRDPSGGRLRYIKSFLAIIDLVAILPPFLGLSGSKRSREMLARGPALHRVRLSSKLISHPRGADP